MLYWILILAAATYDRRVFKFPFIRLISAVVFWLFLVDLLTSGHGTWFAVVTLLTGIGYTLAGHFIGKPSSFWLHLVGGALIGGVILNWFHSSNGDFVFVSIVSLLYVLVAYWTKRSSWAVYGAIGFGLATDYYLGLPTHTGPAGLILGVTQQCTSSYPGIAPTCTSIGPSISPWAPALSYGLLGFWLVALGLLGERKRETTVTVVVETPAPAAG